MKILIAVDSSECSLYAFQSVLDRPWHADTQFEVLTVIEPVLAMYSANIGYVDAIVEVEACQRENAQKLVNQCVAKLGEKFPSCKSTGFISEGSALDAILEQAQKSKSDSIILGSHNRHGINKFFLGSVAEGVAIRAGCAVEIVRAISPCLQKNMELTTSRPA